MHTHAHTHARADEEVRHPALGFHEIPPNYLFG